MVDELITPELIGVYQENIDALINQLGKNVYLEFNPTKEMCPNCEFDTMRGRSRGIYKSGGPRPFPRGGQCPWCKGEGFLYAPVQTCIKSLIKWNPRDAEKYGISIQSAKGIVRLKTFLTYADDLIRAKTVLVNKDIDDKLQLRVKLVKGPIPVGLQVDRYCISFWELL